MATPNTPLWEVFIRSRNGLAHKHCGSLHAADATMALQAARDLYTRRGDYSTNKDGFLVNGAGYYLMGIPVDAKTGNLAGSVPQLLKFQNDFLPAQPTTQIQYRDCRTVEEVWEAIRSLRALLGVIGRARPGRRRRSCR